MEQLEKISLSDFERICRICLKFKQNMMSIYENYIQIKIHGTLGIKLDEDEELPNMICNECLHDLNAAYMFKEICTLSQQIVLNILNVSKKDPLDIECYSKILDDNINITQIPKEEKIEFTKDIRQQILSSQSNQIKESCIKIKSEKEETTNFLNNLTKNVQGKKNDFVVIKVIPDFTSIKKIEKDENKIVDIIGNWILNGKISEHKSNEKEKLNKLECPVCGKKFASMRNVRRHQITHVPKEDREPLICKICHKIYTLKDSLGEHMRQHVSPRKTQCNVCGKVVSHLQLHIIRKHGEKKVLCTICGKKFSTKKCLEHHVKMRHINRVQQTKNVLCEICGNRFHSACKLRLHMYNHTGERPFNCQLCDARFRHRGNLETHFKLVHEKGEREHCCDVCDKKFFTKCMLNKHKRIHINKRPFACQICHKTFNFSNVLHTHMKVHEVVE